MIPFIPDRKCMEVANIDTGCQEGLTKTRILYSSKTAKVGMHKSIWIYIIVNYQVYLKGPISKPKLNIVNSCLSYGLYLIVLPISALLELFHPLF